jgi:hypothetical protein
MANMISQIARGQHTMAEPALQKAMQYYTTLAGGNRAQLASATAPEANAIMDTYKGAERGMTSRMAPGPSQERATAELYRSKAGQLGMLPMMARQSAFGNLSGLGTDLLREGNQLYGTAGNVLSGSNYGLSQLAGMQGQRQQGWVNFGQSMANIFGPWILGKLGVGGGGGTLPNKAPLSTLPPTQAPSVPMVPPNVPRSPGGAVNNIVAPPVGSPEWYLQRKGVMF